MRSNSSTSRPDFKNGSYAYIAVVVGVNWPCPTPFAALGPKSPRHRGAWPIIMRIQNKSSRLELTFLFNIVSENIVSRLVLYKVGYNTVQLVGYLFL